MEEGGVRVNGIELNEPVGGLDKQQRAGKGGGQPRCHLLERPNPKSVLAAIEILKKIAVTSMKRTRTTPGEKKKKRNHSTETKNLKPKRAGQAGGGN